LETLTKPLKYSRDGRVVFDDETHTYTFLPTGQQMTSVTTLLKKFQNPFDPDGKIIERCAKKEGITVEELRGRWEAKRDVSASYGTDVHAEMEHWINTGEIRFTDHSDLVCQYANFRPHRHLLRSETIVYDEEFMIAGQVDVPWYPSKGYVNIDDFKTDEELQTYSPYGNRMLHGLEHLHDTNWSKHQLQLSTYAYLFERKGLKAGVLTIIHVPKLKRTFKTYPCKYMQDEVKYILHTAQQLNFI
jgi:hypothetical protein